MNNIYIWYIPFESVVYSDNMYSILDEEEAKQARKFATLELSQKYVIVHYYLRMLLTYYNKETPPHEWSYEQNKYNKPYLSKKHQKDFYFNLSHTKSAAAIIFSKFENIGIDIEDVSLNISEQMEILDLVFTEKEKYFYTHTLTKNKCFYIYWTLKESYTKAIGKGFSIPFNHVDFSSFNLEDNTYIQDNIHYYTQNFNNKTFLSFCIFTDQNELNILYHNIKEFIA